MPASVKITAAATLPVGGDITVSTSAAGQPYIPVGGAGWTRTAVAALQLDDDELELALIHVSPKLPKSL